MSAETVGRHMPSVVTLDDLAAMIAADKHGHRYERQQYATAGIPRYWMVDRDAAQTVTLHRLDRNGEYEVTTKVPLSWLLNSPPAEHLG